jgi:VWFA-related protein
VSLIAVVVLAALAAQAQSTPATAPQSNVAPAAVAQQPAELPKLVESIDVRVINVDVVVTDRKGNPIKGLTKDDFELYENGRVKPVSNFYEVVATPKPAPAPPTMQPAEPKPVVKAEPIPDNQKRRIIFYIDNLSLAPFNRNRVFTAMKKFIDEVMRPGDEAMIATFNRSMKVRVPFVRDPVQLKQTLDVIAGESALGVSGKSERKDTQGRIDDAQSYDEAVSIARTYSESVQHDLRQSVESLNGLMTTLAGVEGKKVLVLTSEGFPMQPGREMFTHVDEVGRTKSWGSSSMLEGMSFDSNSLIQSVARTANANGITLYTVHAGGLQADDSSAENAKAISYTVSQAALSNSTESMQLMAEMTGGLASISTNNFAAAFKHIQDDLDSYYSLGYRAGTERIDRQRQLEVRVKNKNYVVRNRQTFVEKSTFAEMNDRVIANLLYSTKQNELRIQMKTNTPKPTDDELFRVPVEVQIPMDSLTFLPLGDTEYAGGFELFCVVGNKDGDMSDVARKSHQIRFPKSDLSKTKGKYYSFALDLLMEPGLNRISVGVIDSISNVSGFARDQVLAKDLR